MPTDNQIENLSSQLSVLGFTDDLRRMARNVILFYDHDYAYKHQVDMGGQNMTFYIDTERNGDSYKTSLFNAVLRHPIDIPDVTLDGINTRLLDKKMGKVNWAKEDCDEAWRFINITDRHYAKDYPVQKLVSDIWKLGRAGKDGKDISERLQMKYWGDRENRFNKLIENFEKLKLRFESWSRFHIKDGAPLTMFDAHDLLNGKTVYKPDSIYNIDFAKRLPGGPYVLDRVAPGELSGQQQLRYIDNYYLHVNNDKLNNNIKTSFMIQENLKFLQENVKYMGFADATINDQIAKNMQQGVPEFKLQTSAIFNQSKIDADLHFRKSGKSDMYFFNRYDAGLKDEAGETKRAQTFYINDGKGVTFKEAFNLLEGRAVHKQLTNKDQEKYNAWLQLDFSTKDKHNNYEVKRYTEGYGFDLEKTLKAYPIRELATEADAKKMVGSILKGNVQSINMDVNGQPEKMFIQANPKDKTIELYDSHMKPVTQEQKKALAVNVTDAPAEKQTAKQENSQGQAKPAKQGKNAKDNNAEGEELMQKKRVRKDKGLSVA